MLTGHTPCEWLTEYCPSLDGQFVFMDPLRWDTHLLSEGAVQILHEAATAFETGKFDAFLREVETAGGWPPGLEQLVLALTSLDRAQHRTITRL